MDCEKSNIILIGMAGCGKSSIGRNLSQILGRPFFDTDDLIVDSQKRPLQEIINAEGPMGFRKIEEKILLGIDVRNHVIATGGSSIYSEPGMGWLKERGIVVFLDEDVSVLHKRVGDGAERGLVRQPGQSFGSLFAERRTLYEKHAQITIQCSKLEQQEVCSKILSELRREGIC